MLVIFKEGFHVMKDNEALLQEALLLLLSACRFFGFGFGMGSTDKSIVLLD